MCGTRLSALRRFTEATRRTQGLESLLDEALRHIEETFGACCVAVLLAEGANVVLRASRGFGDPAGTGPSHADLCAAVANRVLRERQPLILPDAAVLAGPLPEQGEHTVRSLMAVPLPLEGDTPGVLSLGTLARQDFHPEDALLLELMADRIGLALQEARTREAERRSRAQLEAVRTAALILAEPIDLHPALQRIVDQARHIAEAEYAALGLVSNDQEASFDPWVFSGLSEDLARRIGRHPRPMGLLGEVPASGKVVRLADMRRDPRFRGVPLHHPGMTSFLGVPITLRGRHLGNLYLANKVGGGAFSQEDEQAVWLLAQHAALAVESAQAHERTHRDMEALRTTHAALQESEERLRRTLEDAPIGMAVVDLDGRFRRINRVLCEIVGRAPEELLGSRFHDITHPEDLELELRETERLLRGELNRLEIIKRYLRKDGSTVEVKLSRSVVRDEHGQPLHFIAQLQDITEQNRFERALLEGERRFRALFDNALEGIAILDNTGQYVDANPAACALLRTPRASLLGRNILEMTDTEVAARRQEMWQRFLHEGEQKGEFALRLPDGRVVEVDYSARAHFMPGQHLAVMRDITQRKRNEAALRRSETMLRMVLENLPVGVWIADDRGGIIQGNPAGQRIWGGARYVSADQLGVYKGWWASTGKPIAAEEWAVSRAVRHGETSIGEVIRIETFDGRRKTILNSAVPVKDPGGKVLGALMVNEDITERLHTETQLKLLAETSALLSTSLDLEATLRGVARLAVTHLGDWCVIDLLVDGKPRRVAAAHRDPLKNQDVQELLRHPPDLSDPEAPLSRVIRTGEPKLEPVMADNSFLQSLEPRSSMLIPLLARDQVLGALTLVSSHPERRYERQDLIPALELAWRAALAMENARLHEQAQRANRMRKEMMAVVSHDLRNPLGAIALRALALERRAERLGDTSTVSDAQALQRSAQQMERLVRDMLDLAAIEGGRLTIQPHPQDLAPLLVELEEMLLPLGERSGVRVVVHRLEAPLRLRCDRNRLLQVLSNLAGNALKFTPEGGQVTVRAWLEDSRVHLSVSDTGPGMSPEELPHIFDRYWRSQNASRTAGVGLGLAIVKGIVEAHGGSVHAESQPGEGSTFHVLLPPCGPPNP